MASRGYMGPSEVQALIGQWVDIIGKDHDDHDRDRDRDKSDYWKKSPPWWQGSKDQWKQLPDWQKQQLWQQGGQQQQPGYPGYPGYPGGQQWPPPGYPQQPPPWYQQQPYWWRQQHPWYAGMPWQPQQPYQPPYQQPPYQQPPYQQPPYQQPPYQPQPSSRPGFHWVPAYGSTPGHWERDRAYVTRDYRPSPSYGSSPVVREHRGGVSVTSSPRERGVQTLTGPGLGDLFSSLFGGTGTISGQWYDLAGPAVGQWYDLQGPMVGADPGAVVFPPRAALVEAPAPTQANRDILPMSTGVPILPTQSAQITGRPQTIAFKIGCYKISNAGTAGGAADWIVNDIKIGNRSQFVQAGDVPGDLFATNAIDTFVRFETAQTAMDVVVVVTYIGLNESGCPFFSAMIGTAAD